MIQIILLIFFLFAFVKVVGRFKAGEIGKMTALGWCLFWVAAMLVVILPNSTAQVAKLVGIGRGADLVVYLALAALFFIMFRLMVKIEQLNKEITVLTRKISLQEKDKPAAK